MHMSTKQLISTKSEPTTLDAFLKADFIVIESDQTEWNSTIKVEEPLDSRNFTVKYLNNLLEETDFISDLEELSELTEEVLIKFMKSKNKSLAFQKRIKELPLEEVLKIYRKLQVELTKLIFKDYGNYSVIALLSRLPEDDRMEFLKVSQGTWIKMCNHTNASLVVQYLLKSASNTEMKLIFNFMKNQIINLAKASLGSYCVQFLMEHANEAQRSTLIKLILMNFYELAGHHCGKFAVYKSLELLLDEKSFKVIKKEINKGQQNGNLKSVWKVVKEMILAQGHLYI